MKQAIRVGLVLTVLAAILLVGSTGSAVALECMGVGDVTTQCGCPAGWYCG